MGKMIRFTPSTTSKQTELLKCLIRQFGDVNKLT